MLGRDGDPDFYFFCGRSALDCIEKALDVASISPDRITRILDLPCGHGRVLRWLKAAFPGATITACDLLRGGVDFCSSTFGAVGLYSCDEPEAIRLEPGGFDLIWVGSLFTHLDAHLWVRFLTVFRKALCPGGLLVFTTHGREAYRRIVDKVDNTFSSGIGYWQRTHLLYRYERTGFGYVQYPGSESYYGFSLSHPAWVVRQLTEIEGLRIANVSERAWVTLQDVFTCVRVPDSHGDMHRTSGMQHARHTALARMNPRVRSLLARVWRGVVR
jgi:SAM-dependent methyltransferase